MAVSLDAGDKAWLNDKPVGLVAPASVVSEALAKARAIVTEW